jgi:cytochrome c biogenesis protein CcmG/thiol:disulfide interchange protein DsbE
VLAVAGLLAFLGYGLVRVQDVRAGGTAVNAVGRAIEVKPRPAPDFALVLFEGGSFRLSEESGKTVLVNFWASWCPPCREEAPALEAAWRAHRDRGVVFVGVNVWDRERDARAFLAEYRSTYPNGPDPGRTALDFGVRGLPETFVVAPDGQVVRKWIGPITEAEIASLLAGMAGALEPAPQSAPLPQRVSRAAPAGVLRPAARGHRTRGMVRVGDLLPPGRRAAGPRRCPAGEAAPETWSAPGASA